MNEHLRDVLIWVCLIICLTVVCMKHPSCNPNTPIAEVAR